MRHLRFAVLTGLLCVVAAARPARAQITVHTTFAAWLAAVSGAGLDTFDDLDPDEGFVETPQSRTAGAFAYVASAPNGMFPAGTADDPMLSNFFIDDALTFDAFSPSAFGVAGEFLLTDEDGQPSALSGNLTVTVRSGTFTATETLVGATTARFLGFTGVDAITSLSIKAVDASQANGIFATANDLWIGGATSSAVPEPSTLVLLVAGIAGMVGVARRRVTPSPEAPSV